MTIKTKNKAQTTKRPAVKALPPYFGGKRKIADTILQYAPMGCTVIDVMGGAMNVAYAAKQKGHSVIANDRMYGPYIFGKALIENHTDLIDIKSLDKLLVPSQESFISVNFADVHLPAALARIADNIRGNIDAMYPNNWMYLALLYNFLTYVAPFNMFRYEAFVQQYNAGKAFSKSLQLYADKWTNTIGDPLPRLVTIANNLNAAVVSGTGTVHNMDVFSFMDSLAPDPNAVMYFDPPYCGARVKYERGYQVIDEMIKKQRVVIPVSLFNNKARERDVILDALKHTHKFHSTIFSYWTKLHDRAWFEGIFNELELDYVEVPLNGYKYSLSGYIGGQGPTSGDIQAKVDNLEILYVLKAKSG